MTPSNRIVYDERLTPPKAWWGAAMLFGIAVALVFFPYGPIAALIALAIGTCLAGMFVSAQGSTRIRVTADTLFVADARIPLVALGQPEALHGEDARAWRTYKADMRAFMVMRSFVTGAVRVEVVDPDDPTPYLYLSTRTPELLIRALAPQS
ncbi:DUF3093 domain-containing protein [Streptomyces sp. BPPL-273]|uniref:DUF3093 domain-containing protein n=1 Tax=Streptomyces TaxID=1883 RepID=UPI0024AEDA38|nr:DUF3093 domain-containing protein [Streptomyces sp. BPPL-273]WHM29912.1 DUF3093 domain-containing protein [Streptomyces sp. BPPL-273]